MRYVRVYATADGESHIEDVEPEGVRDEDGTVMLLDSPASQTTVVRFPPNYRQNWHCSPVETLCVVLSGEAFFSTSDGQTRRFGPGAAIITDDTTGRGHVTGATKGGAVLLVLRLSKDG